MIKKYIVFEVEVRTDGEKHEVGITDVTEKVVVRPIEDNPRSLPQINV